MAKGHQLSATSILIVAVLSVLAAGGALSAGATAGSEETAVMLFKLFGSVFGTLTVGGLIAEATANSSQKQLVKGRNESLKQLTSKYNSVTEMLISDYTAQHQQMKGRAFRNEREQLRQRYERLYRENSSAYRREKRNLMARKLAEPRLSGTMKTFWKAVFALGIMAQTAACSYTLGTSTGPEAQPVEAPRIIEADGGCQTMWTARSLPMPHLTDHSRYVTNPDGILSAQTEQQLNAILMQMDDSLGIESAVVAVNHVEDGDVFRVAQDIFDIYKVGRDDRGMVVVLAYGDHKVRTHTGRSLEADLTDIECSRLQQTYAIPFMKAEQPDSGMIYLIKAINSTLEKKQLPQTGTETGDDLSTLEILGLLYMALFCGWGVLGYVIAARYGKVTPTYFFMPNPFTKQNTSSPDAIFMGGGSNGSRPFGGGGGGFGGGLGGGGFSGGGSGGGGATSSW